MNHRKCLSNLKLILLAYATFPLVWILYVPRAVHNSDPETPATYLSNCSVLEERSRAGEEILSLPHFFILGCTKSGTSSLSHHLHSHQQIEPAFCQPEEGHYCSGKELTFFGHSFYEERGLSWYQERFVNQTGVFTFDATPSYFYMKRARQQLQKHMNDRQKAIVLVRDPAKRAYSQWQMQQRFLKQEAPVGVSLKPSWKTPFTELVKSQIHDIKSSCGEPPSEPYGEAADSFIHCLENQNLPLQHVYAGLYWAHLRLWTDFLSPGQLLLLETEELKRRPIESLDRVTDFLGLQRFTVYPDVSIHYNSATSYGPEYEDMPDTAHYLLDGFYEAHNKLLYKMLGRVFEWGRVYTEHVQEMPSLLPPLSTPKLLVQGSQPELDQLGIKIYMYPMPDWVFSPSSQKWGYYYCASEMAFYWRMSQKSAGLLTDNPEEANLFYIPGYWTAAIFGDTSQRVNRERGREFVLAALNHVQSNWPYWNRHGGADHFLLFSYDYGVCMDHRPHRVGETAAANQLRRRLQQSVLLSTLGDVNSVCYTHHKDVVIPPMMKHPASAWHTSIPFEQRRIRVHFRGRIEIGLRSEMWDGDEEKAAPNPAHQQYSEGVRQRLFELYRGKSGWLVEKSMLSYDSYLLEIKSSQFCLAPRGHAAWTVRLFESLAYGCIPVIIADGIVLPFQDIFDWNQVALFVKQADIDRLDTLLEAVTVDEALFMARSGEAFRASLLFDPDGDEHSRDAFYWSVRELARRVGIGMFPGIRT